MTSPAVMERLTRKLGASPLVLGHRGARHAAPENTHAAFELSRHEGGAGVELDVRLVKTGQIVVLHDPTLGRVTGNADRRIDWIFSRGFSVKRAATLTDHKGPVQTSDHFPVIAELAFTRPE
jgi:glycerophosphoryl diester phosphodiesterase